MHFTLDIRLGDIIQAGAIILGLIHLAIKLTRLFDKFNARIEALETHWEEDIKPLIASCPIGTVVCAKWDGVTERRKGSRENGVVRE